jgi:META domain
MRGSRHQIWIGALIALLVLVIAAPAAGAAGPSWSFETPRFDFGDTPAAGGPTQPHEFVLTNTGDEAITIGKLVIGVGVNHVFERTESTCPGGTVLEPGGSCHVLIAFDPTTSGRKTGYLKAEALNEEPPLAEVEFEGEGVGPTVSIEAERLEFGSVQDGVTSPRQTITVENRGPQPLQIYGVSNATWDFWGSTLEYPAATPFGLEGGSCKEGMVLAVSGTCTMEVAFTPSKVGMFSSILSLADNASPGSPQQIQLGGTGVAARPTTPPSDSTSPSVTPSSGSTPIGSSAGQSESPRAAPAPDAEAAHHSYEPPARLWTSYVASKVSAGRHQTPFAKLSKVKVYLEKGADQNGSENHMIGWKARCNSVGGGVRVTSSRLVPVRPASTLIECPRQESKEDRWLDGFFDSDPIWHLRGTQLILRAGKKTLVLRPSGT